MMKRSITLLALIFILLCACSNSKTPVQTNLTSTSHTPSPSPVENIPLALIGEEAPVGWTFVSDEYYKLLRVDTDHPILLSIPQDSDYAKALASLVDESAVPMTSQEIEAIQADPNASMVDNVLPDGRFLKENWVQLQNEIVEASQTVRIWSQHSISAPINSQVFETIVNTGHGELLLNLQKLQVDDKTIFIPKSNKNFPAEFTITPDGQKSFVHAENGLWLINRSNNQLEQLSSNTYNGKTYEALVKESFDLYKENVIHWNAGVLPSPDSTKLVYQSRKNNIEAREATLFVFDLASGVETMITHSENVEYRIEGWVTSDSIICTKYQDSGITLVLISLNGEEINLPFEGESPIVYSVKDGLIAYATHRSSNSEFHIARVDEVGVIHEIFSTQLDERIVMRGIKSFSPKLSYAAILCSSNNSSIGRYVKVVDLSTNTVTVIDSLPEGTNTSADILEFSWANDNTLLVTIQEDVAKAQKMSTWTYSLS